MRKTIVILFLIVLTFTGCAETDDNKNSEIDYEETKIVYDDNTIVENGINESNKQVSLDESTAKENVYNVNVKDNLLKCESSDIYLVINYDTAPHNSAWCKYRLNTNNNVCRFEYTDSNETTILGKFNYNIYQEIIDLIFNNDLVERTEYNETINAAIICWYTNEGYSTPEYIFDVSNNYNDIQKYFEKLVLIANHSDANTIVDAHDTNLIEKAEMLDTTEKQICQYLDIEKFSDSYVAPSIRLYKTNEEYKGLGPYVYEKNNIQNGDVIRYTYTNADGDSISTGNIVVCYEYQTKMNYYTDTEELETKYIWLFTSEYDYQKLRHIDKLSNFCSDYDSWNDSIEKVGHIDNMKEFALEQGSWVSYRTH